MRSFHLFTAFMLLCLIPALGCRSAPSAAGPGMQWPTLDGQPPLVIAHRGASGLRPEHTIEAYALAILQGADLIEPDIVITRDGVPICRHDLYLSTTTDVAAHPEFADRRRTFAGRDEWFAFDFTLAEIKTLRTRQSFPGRSRADDGRFEVPTLEEVLALVERTRRQTGRAVGMHIEIKHPAAHHAAGLDSSRLVLDVLARARVGEPWPATYLQCFELPEVRRLIGMTDYPVVYLSSDPVEPEQLPAGLAGLGLNKNLIDPYAPDRGIIARAHARGLVVHAWTFRDDRLAPDSPYPDGAAEIMAYFAAGVDGVFTDFPASGVQARQRLSEGNAITQTQARSDH